MKAAVIHAMGTLPRFETFPDPVAGPDEVLITVKASALKQLDKLKVSGRHYTTFDHLPATVGVDGTGILEDGTRVYAGGISGMMAEKSLVKKGSWVELPDDISFTIAAALPNALMGSDGALLYRAGIKKGDVVLVNGATGVSGKMAVQLAKLRGAAKVIATGRNAAILDELKILGADEVISLKQNDEDILQTIIGIQRETPVDIVIDYLWGHPAVLLLTAFKKSSPHKIRFVTVGEMAGADLSLASGVLRSTRIELLGSGIGSISKEEMNRYFKEELPVMFRLAASGRLKIDIETAALKDIEEVWGQDAAAGKRLVITL
jgi:NADPH:quinone reductase-like Zn-dependent oxidoreductase